MMYLIKRCIWCIYISFVIAIKNN